MQKRILKSGEIRYYNGKRLASEAEIKQYIKSEFDSIKKSDLPDAFKGYYGKVAGGKKRAETGARIEGKYIYKEFERKIKLNELAEIRGYKSGKELLEKDKEFAQSLSKIYSQTGLEYSYNSDNVLKKVQSFNGKIKINGVEYSAKKAAEMIDKTDKKIKRAFGNFINVYNVKYKKGGAIMEFNLPSDKDIKNAENEEIEDVDLDGVDLIFSGKKGK